jgi:protein-S-isoprenylcysteine O-methyltransferase Ste14
MKKLLPPVLFAFSLVAMIVANRFLPIPEIIPERVRPASLPAMLAGLGLLAAARIQFMRKRTNIYTFDEPGVLVTDGVFRLRRHPMYLGFALFLLGSAIGLGSVSAFAVWAVFVTITDRWYITFEERWLLRKFGEEYERYAARTRRWV